LRITSCGSRNNVADRDRLYGNSKGVSAEPAS
jgi:hypothetical protein